MTTRETTKENILRHFELKVQPSFKTQEDMQDDWRKTANKYQVKILYYPDRYINHFETYVTDYYMGVALKHKPSIKDVLYSILMDDVSCLSFNDFCNEFGYDSDSIKALKIYEACQKETKFLHEVIKPEHVELLRELLEDY